MRSKLSVRTTAARRRQRFDGALLAQLVPHPRRPLTSEQMAVGLRDAGVEVLPDLPETSTVPYEVHRSSRGDFVNGVALASWLSEDERVVVLQSLRRRLLESR